MPTRASHLLVLVLLILAAICTGIFFIVSRTVFRSMM